MPVVDPSVAAGNANETPQGQVRDLGRNTLTKDDFLKIFLAQMKMQSPLKPYDSAAMLEQMSQFTSLTATEELNSTIKNLNSNLGKSQVISATQLIGKHVRIPSELSPLVEGEGLKGSVILGDEVSDVTITIKDDKGTVVKTIKKGPSSSGLLDFDWDGMNDAGTKMDAGMYQISATATVNGKPVQYLTAGDFKVGSVGLNPKSGAVFLNIEGFGGVSMDNVIKIV